MGRIADIAPHHITDKRTILRYADYSLDDFRNGGF
jgi:hypothetical protein